MTLLTQEQQDDAAHVASLVPEGATAVLDLSDPRQYRHVVDTHLRAGNTPERYPGLHAALERARELHASERPPQLADAGPWQTEATIVALGQTETGAAAAHGYVSVVGGGAGVYASLQVTAPNGQTLAEYEQKAWVDGYFLDIATDPDTAQPAVDGMTATLNTTVIVNGQAVPLYASASLANAASDPVVEQPQPTSTKATTIIIGLGRGANTSDGVDYWFDQASPDQGIYMVPLVCTVDFGQPIQEGSLQFSSSLTRAQGRGGGTVKLSDAQVQIVLGRTSEQSSSSFRTNCPAKSTSGGSDALVFTNVNWTTDDTTFFKATYQAMSTSGRRMFAVIASSTSADVGVDGVANILPIVFTWHCVAADTLVQRADGSTVAIREVLAGDELRAPDGSARLVYSTWGAPHKGPITRLKTDSGQELLLTFNHVVMTPDGPTAAAELAVGDLVNAEGGGTASLTSLEDKDFDGLLCNVSLGPVGEDADPAARTFLAGGIATCDYEVQTQHRRRQLADPRFVRRALPEELLPDYESWLAGNA